MADPVVSVVIPVRDGAKTLPAQLDALARQVLEAPWEVVLADNGSADGSPALAAQWAGRLPALRVVDASAVPGVSRARNAGIRAARGRVIAICDADDVVAPGWLAALLAGIDRFDVVAGCVAPWTGKGAPRRVPSADPPELTVGLGYLPFAWGCNVAFKREVFDRIGGFDEAMVGGADDVDFSWRAIDAGYSLGLSPAAVVHYRQPERLGELARKYFRRGRQAPALYNRFRSRGMPPRGWRTMVKVWLWLLMHLPSTVLPASRRRWVEVAAGHAGRLVGSVQTGVLYS